MFAFSIRVGGIYADTTVLVGAPFILGYCVKCIPIYLVPFVCEDMSRWLPSQQIQLLINTLITLTFFLQLVAESFHVLTRNPSFRLPLKLGSEQLFMCLDIRIHQGGVLQNYVVCFIKIIVLHTNICFLP